MKIINKTRIKVMKKVMFIIALVVFTSTWASAESSVWKVQKNNSIMYLGGTCHLLRKSDFPLPEEFNKAYKASDLLVFETDLAKLQDPATQQKLNAKAIYADGSMIYDHLSIEAYGMLCEYCVVNSIPIENIKPFKPSIVIISLTMMELMKLGVTQEGVDIFFHKLAIKDKKTVGKLETVEEQINFLVDMGKGDEDAFMTHSLGEMKNIKLDFEKLISAWKTGDIKKLKKMLITDFKTNTPKVYKQLITDRNKNWMPIIKAYGKTSDKEFILVGVAHLVGPDGLIEALKKDGYKIDKL